VNKAQQASGVQSNNLEALRLEVIRLKRELEYQKRINRNCEDRLAILKKENQNLRDIIGSK
jgi:hypothetical protein